MPFFNFNYNRFPPLLFFFNRKTQEEDFPKCLVKRHNHIKRVETKGTTAMKVGINLNIEQIFASCRHATDGFFADVTFYIGILEGIHKTKPDILESMITITMLSIWNEKNHFFSSIIIELNETKQTDKRMVVAACMYTSLFFQIVSKSILEM